MAKKKKQEVVKMIDPPHGWLYGFPKPIPEEVTDLHEWLLQNGYPERNLRMLGKNFPCRFWYEDVK